MANLENFLNTQENAHGGAPFYKDCKTAGCNFIKIRLHHGCFLLTFVKFSGKTLFKNSISHTVFIKTKI